MRHEGYKKWSEFRKGKVNEKSGPCVTLANRLACISFLLFWSSLISSLPWHGQENHPQLARAAVRWHFVRLLQIFHSHRSQISCSADFPKKVRFLVSSSLLCPTSFLLKKINWLKGHPLFRHLPHFPESNPPRAPLQHVPQPHPHRDSSQDSRRENRCHRRPRRSGVPPRPDSRPQTGRRVRTGPQIGQTARSDEQSGVREGIRNCMRPKKSRKREALEKLLLIYCAFCDFCRTCLNSKVTPSSPDRPCSL
jgi:hypothetical protein